MENEWTVSDAIRIADANESNKRDRQLYKAEFEYPLIDPKENLELS